MGESEKWTSASIPDMSGRLAVVTGGNSGIGYATSLALAERGARVVLACRRPDRAQDAVRRMREASPSAAVEAAAVDLADLGSIRGFAAEFGHTRVDLLVNNAGVALAPRSRTAEGFETHFGVNHLGTFALTSLLLPRLLAAPRPRVVTVTSEAQRVASLDLDDPNCERRYRPWAAYLRSKRANLYFAAELQRRAAAAGTRLLSMGAAPGLTRTNVLGGRGERAVLRRVVQLLGKPAAGGAVPVLYAATADLPGGSYIAPGGPMQQRGAPKDWHRTRTLHDTGTAARLWAMSEAMTGIRPDFGPGTG
ncbi:MAG: SDR family NAD(P)-dependent oxidoreductase [Streptomyces sp.]|nr:SDR family NAD(P)-dependent oxidoreductase [Streptomyces sp.]